MLLTIALNKSFKKMNPVLFKAIVKFCTTNQLFKMLLRAFLLLCIFFAVPVDYVATVAFTLTGPSLQTTVCKI